MRRVLVTVLLALQPGAAFSPEAEALIAKCKNVAQLSDLKGEISAVGGADASEPCGWHIYPDRRLGRMQFRVNESRLEGGDELAFYSYNLEHPSALIGLFSVYQPAPAEMELRGSDEVLIVFSAKDEGSFFRLTYEAFPTNEIRFFSLYLSPVSFVVCIVGIVLGVCLAVAIAVCCVRKCRNRRTSYGKQPSPGEPTTSAQQVVIPVAVEIPVAPPIMLDARTGSATTPGDSSSDIASSPQETTSETGSV